MQKEVCICKIVKNYDPNIHTFPGYSPRVDIDCHILGPLKM